MRKRFDYTALMGEGNPLLRYPRLLEAAIDEFSKKKFEEASLNDILKNSGISKGSLYHHFGGKFGLYLAMMDIIVKKKLSYFYPVMRQKADSGSDFFSSLKEIMKGTMDFMLTDKRLHHLLNIVLEENDEFRNRLYGFFPYDYTRHFSEFICQAVESGQIDSRYPPEFVAKVLEIMFSNIHKLISKGDPEDLIKTANQVVDMIQYGISGK
ncbi:MAG: TetR/AcrR family transcriptional regulator [Firmicutes bacterium]|nr:TetR/AcrR family transcriptional regulator [Bacillota bacterium]HQD39304.1 TetR/AcrR family transcriptional regulator [Bacillota bacterium]